MRIGLPLVGILAVAAFAAPEGEETPPEPSPYAAMGFPVTFNDEVITPNDVARFIETKLEDIDPGTLRRSRDLILFRKINERIAADLSLLVGDREVDAALKREIDSRGGDAKFYEYLAQQGTTLERHRLEVRQRYIDQVLDFLLRNGFSHDRQQLLPWRVGPTPREIETAFKNDPELRGGALRARRLRFVVDASQQTRGKLSLRQIREEITPEEVAKEIEKDVRPRLEAALAALKERPFADVAKEHGARDVDAMAKEWVTLTGATEVEKFLATAEPGAWSTPERLPTGAYEIVCLVERDNPSERKAGDPAVAEEYSRRIRGLRATKWQAMLRLRALDESTVRPDRVRDELRAQILDALREADAGLMALGLR